MAEQQYLRPSLSSSRLRPSDATRRGRRYPTLTSGTAMSSARQGRATAGRAGAGEGVCVVRDMALPHLCHGQPRALPGGGAECHGGRGQRGGPPGGGARSSMVAEAGLPSSPCSLPFYLAALNLVRAGHSSPPIIAAACSSISSPAPSLHGHAKDADAPLAGWMDAAPSPATSSPLLHMWCELEHHRDEGHTGDPRRQERHTRRQGRACHPPKLSWRWPFFNLTLVKVFNLPF
jgi:hypothetical protein